MRSIAQASWRSTRTFGRRGRHIPSRPACYSRSSAIARDRPRATPLGEKFIAAQAEHGESLRQMAESNKLPFDWTTAFRLMEIAKSDVARGQRRIYLPASWGTLYELTKLPDARIGDRRLLRSPHAIAAPFRSEDRRRTQSCKERQSSAWRVDPIEPSHRPQHLRSALRYKPCDDRRLDPRP